MLYERRYCPILREDRVTHCGAGAVYYIRPVTGEKFGKKTTGVTELLPSAKARNYSVINDRLLAGQNGMINYYVDEREQSGGDRQNSGIEMDD